VTLAEPPAPADQPVNFKRPPVTEVVLAIQFEQKVIDLEVLAEFTARVKADFPGRAQRAPLPPMEEIDRQGSGPQFSLELVSDFQMPRTWFTSADEQKILQLQDDRFVFNWQRPNPTGTDYPRYLQLREAFRERLAQLVESVHAADKEMPGTNFCEVTYVNQVPLGTGQGELRLTDVLAAVQAPEYSFLPEPDDQQYGARFPIAPEGDGGPRGAMFVNAAPASRPDGTPMYVMNLTSRLVPGGNDPDSAWFALDLGREWIVRGFVELTTKEMHERWGYEEGGDDR
jgi:uncharacterized protein (TIGR04255 family)